MQPGKKNTIEHTMGTGLVHLYMLPMIIPILLVFSGPFILIWDLEELRTGIKLILHYFLPVLLIGVAVHELLHGISWSLFASKGIKSIKFGIHWKFLAPYCHCTEPLKVKHYITGAAMPLLILGILPSVSAIVFGNGALLVFGILFTWAAGGDIISIFMLRKLDKNSFVSDHPDKMGFYKEVESNIGRDKSSASTD
jgi:hypothetical protein